jgi:hypothetical protein
MITGHDGGVDLSMFAWPRPAGVTVRKDKYMPNITLSVDEETIKKVRKVAIDRNTTLTAMVREFLQSVGAREATSKRRAVKELRQTYGSYSRDMGERSWTREDLHER